MSYQEKTRGVVDQFSIGLNHLPELKPLFTSFKLGNLREEIGEEPIHYIARTYLGYLGLIKDLATLSDSDIKLVRRINKQCKKQGLSSGSAVNHGADHFLLTIGKSNKHRLLSFAVESSDIKSLVFQDALSDLVGRMTKGHELAEAGVDQTDGVSQKVDWAIYGHTKGLQTRAMIHFLMAHFLERTITQAFKQRLDKKNNNKIRKLISPKDFFLQALGDVIRLQKSREEVTEEIYEMWRTPREEGGLGWNKDDQQAVFDEIVSTSQPSTF